MGVAICMGEVVVHYLNHKANQILPSSISALEHDQTQCHASSPPHALTPDEDCKKIAEGKQSNERIHRVADSVRLST